MRDPSPRRYRHDAPPSFLNHHHHHHDPQQRSGRPLSPLSTSPTNQQHHSKKQNPDVFTFADKPKKRTMKLPTPRQRPPTPELRMMMMTAKKTPENATTNPIKTTTTTAQRGRMMEGGTNHHDTTATNAWTEHFPDAHDDWHWKQPSSSTENQEPIGTLERPIELVDEDDVITDSFLPGTSIHQPIVLDTREHEILESAEYKRQRKAISKKVNQAVLPDSFSISTTAPTTRNNHSHNNNNNNNNHKDYNKQKQKQSKSQPQQPLSKKGGLLRSLFSGMGRNKKNSGSGGKQPNIASSFSSDMESHLPVDKSTPHSQSNMVAAPVDIPGPLDMQQQHPNEPEPLLLARAKASTTATPRLPSPTITRKNIPTHRKIRNGIVQHTSAGASTTNQISSRPTTPTLLPSGQQKELPYSNRQREEEEDDDDDDFKFLEAHDGHPSSDWSHNATADPFTTTTKSLSWNHSRKWEQIPPNQDNRRRQTGSKALDDDTATTVSGVTNPTFALSNASVPPMDAKKKKKKNQKKDALHHVDPFDVDSTQFSSGVDPFLKITTKVPSPGDFSDAFFSAAESQDDTLGGDSSSTDVVPNPPPSAMVAKLDTFPASKRRVSSDEDDSGYIFPAPPPPKALDSGVAKSSSIPVDTSPNKKSTETSTANPESRSPPSFLAPTASARAKVRERRQQQQKQRNEAAAVAAVTSNLKPTTPKDEKRQQQSLSNPAVSPSMQSNQGPSKLRVMDLIENNNNKNSKNAIPETTVSNNVKGFTKVTRPRIVPEGGDKLPIKQSYQLVDPPLIKRAHIRSRIKNKALSQDEGDARLPQQKPQHFQHIHLATSASSDNSSVSHSIKRKSTSESMSSSVGSDMQRLRSILRRSRMNKNPENVVRYTEPLESAFAVIDDKKIKDPMQRAGVRLLSAAVIPIQCAIRRHLALRHALTRMWSIVAIQTCVRRWMTQRFYQRKRQAAISIQTIYRGGSVRDQVLLEHCCAIEIQRHVRGYLASLNVCEQIYMITLVQACMRRKLAINRAMDRMVSVIQIQALSKGFLTRCNYLQKKKSATKIQASWRGFSSRFSFQLDLLDIIIVQSIFRRKLASIQFRRLLHERRVRCATLIQSHWRSYDCTMNYLHYLADVLIAQSAVRRWMARKRCHSIREKNAVILQSAFRCFFAKLELERIRSAILIQKLWRGYSCYTEYMFTMSDIVLVQSVARCWLQRKEYPKRLHARRTDAAVCIQKYLRCFSQMSKYNVLVCENKAATSIQTSWRQFYNRSEFLSMKNSAIQIQSFFRGFSVRQILMADHFIATLIQSAFRRYSAQKRVKTALILHNIQRGYIEVARRESENAKSIQSLFRGIQARKIAKVQRSARHLQTVWRGRMIRSSFIRYISARKIQSLWRRLLALRLYKKNLKARSIQAIWRGYIDRINFFLHITARSIQKIWRGYVARSLLSSHRAARQIQSLYRGYILRVSINLFLNARRIQSAWRGYTVRHSFNYFMAARRIQTTWRCRCLRQKFIRFINARRIQARWRCFFLHEAYKHYISARKIQSVWRCFTLTVAYKHFISARRIQTLWRFKHARDQYLSYIAARRLQAFWRGKSLQSAYIHYIAARRIQAFWRCKLDQTAYVQFIAARRIQTFWRCKFERTAYLDYVAARRIQTFWRCMSARNAFKVYYAKFLKRQKEKISATCIQTFWRSSSLRNAFLQYISARRIQSLWRCFSDRRVFVIYLTAHRSARTIQTFWRCRSLEKVFIEYKLANNAAIRIQCAFRKLRARKVYHRRYARKVCRENLGVITIQRYARGYACRRECASFNRSVLEMRSAARAAVKIQRLWRGYYANQSYWQILGSTILIQAVIRGWRAQLHLKRIRESVLTEIRAANMIKSFLRSKIERCRFLHTVGAAMVIQSFFREWVEVKIKEEKVKNEAAAKIQTFFLMIKAEVDREIQHQNSRRKRPKRRKANKTGLVSRPDMTDDELLECAWQASIEPDFHQSETIRLATEAAMRALGRWQSMHPDKKVITNEENEENSCLLSNVSSLANPSLISQTGRSQPLVSSLSSKEIDDNWNLEEAWIDAEIHDVKERRRLMRKSKHTKHSARPQELTSSQTQDV